MQDPYPPYSFYQKFSSTQKYYNKIESGNIENSFTINTQIVIEMKHSREITMDTSCIFLKKGPIVIFLLRNHSLKSLGTIFF